MKAALLAAALSTSPCDLTPPPGEDWRDEINPIEAIAPVFPEFAEVVGSRAICWVRFDITEAGRTTNFCTRCSVEIDPAPDPALTARAADLAAELLAGASRSAVRSWRFAPEHSPYHCSRAAFHFLLDDQDPSDLPADPRHQRCREVPIN
ncbi:MAG: hypothetical protein AAFX09_05220 [Pseudomonadota bacterium]